MKAMQISRFGDANEFNLAETARPAPGSKEVLIKVEATSINPLDVKLRKGSFPDLLPSFPAILHGDVAGTVMEVGDEVSQFKVGDEIFGCIGGLAGKSGALAEYVVADQSLIALKPKSLDFAEAAAIPLVGETVWEALFVKAKLRAGQSILIYGGTGGVGHFAALVANALGAEVTVTASNDAKADLIKSRLGINNVVLYKQEAPLDSAFDVVFDTVGSDNIQNASKAVAANGKVVTVLPSSRADLSELFFKNATLHFVFQPLPLISGKNPMKYATMLKDMANFIDENKIKPLIDRKCYPIHEVAFSHSYFESGNAVGKVILTNEW